MHRLRNYKSLIIQVARLILLIISFYLLLRIVDIAVVIKTIVKVPIYILLLLLTISLFRAWLTGIRWSLLNPDLSGQITKWHYFRYTMIGFTFNLIMPGALGGDFARTAITVSKVKKNKGENIIAIIVDRFIGLFSILLLGLLAFALAKDLLIQNSIYILFCVFILMIIVVILVTRPAFIILFEKNFSSLSIIGPMIDKVLYAWKNALIYFKNNKQKVLYAFLLCLPIHLIAFVSKYLLAHSLGIDVSFFSICLITAIVWLITAVPITISGAGVRELSMVYLLSLYGVAAEDATALAAYTYIISFIMALIGVVLMVDFDKWFRKCKLKLSEGSNNNL